MFKEIVDDARRTTDDARWTTDAGHWAITKAHHEHFGSGELKTNTPARIVSAFFKSHFSPTLSEANHNFDHEKVIAYHGFQYGYFCC